MGFKDIKYDFPVYQMENTQIHTQVCKYTKTKCLKDPTCAIFFKSMGFKDIKYDIPVAHSTWHVFPFNWSPIQHSTGPPIQFVPKFRTMC